MTQNVIEITKLVKIYGEGDAKVVALREVDLQVRHGEFVAIMGPSGSGKSTLMNILGCLDRATSGLYILDGEDVSRLSKEQLAGVRNRKIGFVFQSFNLLPRLSALKNVMLPMMYNGFQYLDATVVEARAAAVLRSVGLGDRLHHTPAKLSGGQQQRVAIARALINEPSIIMADEPTGNLDSRSSDEIMGILHRLHNDGATIVMVTHEADRAANAQRVIEVLDGRIMAEERSSAVVELIAKG
ncbi:MAG TPA: ABC transporter ATP-binding protein [Caldilineaceae bacterium]|nr:ABC transporter ATP-binding protein [Caldilineaceae bacterium]